MPEIAQKIAAILLQSAVAGNEFTFNLLKTIHNSF